MVAPFPFSHFLRRSAPPKAAIQIAALQTNIECGD